MGRLRERRENQVVSVTLYKELDSVCLQAHRLNIKRFGERLQGEPITSEANGGCTGQPGV